MVNNKRKIIIIKKRFQKKKVHRKIKAAKQIVWHYLFIVAKHNIQEKIEEGWLRWLGHICSIKNDVIKEYMKQK